MIIYVGKDYQDVSRKAANIMSAQIIMKPNAVLGLATGSNRSDYINSLSSGTIKVTLIFHRSHL